MCSSKDKLSYVRFALALIEFEDCSPYLAAHSVLPHLSQTGRHSSLEHYLEADRAQGERNEEEICAFFKHRLEELHLACFLLSFSPFLVLYFCQKTPDETLCHAFK